MTVSKQLSLVPKAFSSTENQENQPAGPPLALKTGIKQDIYPLACTDKKSNNRIFIGKIQFSGWRKTISKSYWYNEKVG